MFDPTDDPVEETKDNGDDGDGDGDTPAGGGAPAAA